MLPMIVHITPIREEVEAVVAPALEHDADRVHLITDTQQEVAEKTQVAIERLQAAQIDVESHRCDHTELIAMMGLVTTLTAEYDRDDHVLVNTSTGRRTAAIGATLGCMDTDTPARAFRLTSDGDETPMFATEQGNLLPECLIESPSWQEIAVLAIIYTEEVGYTRAKKRTVIDRMLKITFDQGYDVRFGLVKSVLGGDGSGQGANSPAGSTDLSDPTVGDGGTKSTEGPPGTTPGGAPAMDGSVRRFDDLDGKARKRAYARLDTILDSLVTEGHISALEVGRSKELTVTEEGGDLLRAFRHKARPVIDYQSEVGRAEVPEWLKQGFV